MLSIGSCFLLLYKILNSYLIEVEISYQSIKNLTANSDIDWLEVKSIQFRWFGLYEIKLADEKFFFFPYGQPLGLFGLKFNTDDLDVIIEKRKRELNI